MWTICGVVPRLCFLMQFKIQITVTGMMIPDARDSARIPTTSPTPSAVPSISSEDDAGGRTA